MNELETEIKKLIIESLNLEDLTPDDIKSDEALFVEGLGLDSIDALELSMGLQKKYGIKIEAKNDKIKEHFFSVETLAHFINEQKK
ncbi:MAG: acyl carrier protein [Alphaproteobacteria bacterium]|nr:acyl carrier protein [Alphaproteobacteria bacterium]NCQ66127.1 acyl carrier protein [Alphaproteobacteria bacterium]NCT06475.1 acyl carrier protein [Alphaproteobacteria bacterium]